MQYNAFGQSGVMIMDPKIVVWLREHEDEKFGMNNGNIGVKEVIEWLVMHVLGTNYGDVRKYCTENDSSMICETRHGETIFYYNEE